MLFGRVVALGLVLLVLGVLGQRFAGSVLGMVEAEYGSTTNADRHASNVYSDSVRLPRLGNGHFFADILVDGASVRVLIDTGASSLMLRESDAASAGIFVMPSDFTISVATANGDSTIAAGRAREVELGPFRVGDVAMGIARDDDLPVSLLGMNVLSQLGSIEFNDSELTIAGKR
jgi:aspartyl protease family protein